ncbi:MAG: hypothetical protein AAB848_00110 [Patescibacteria group bacterium]
MSQQGAEFNFDHPTFADANRRLELKQDDSLFFVNDKGCILKASVRKVGLMPECNFSRADTLSTHIGCLESGMIWGRTEDEVRERLQQKKQEQSAGGSEETQVLMISDSTTAIISLEQRLDIQRSAGDAIVLNDKGGIDMSDIQAAATDLTIRIAHPISAFGVESMEYIAAEGFINPILYRVLEGEFNELFGQIKNILSALDAVQALPETVVNGMRQALYMSANALTFQFLQRHAELIEFTQLATVTNGDFAARALLAIVNDGTNRLKDLPPAAQYLVDKFRVR